MEQQLEVPKFNLGQKVIVRNTRYGTGEHISGRLCKGKGKIATVIGILLKPEYASDYAIVFDEDRLNKEKQYADWDELAAITKVKAFAFRSQSIDQLIWKTTDRPNPGEARAPEFDFEKNVVLDTPPVERQDPPTTTRVFQCKFREGSVEVEEIKNGEQK